MSPNRRRKMYSNVNRAKRFIILLILLLIPTVTFAKNTQTNQSEKICLAKAIYHEAKGEPEIGKRAVAKVVLNRKNHQKYPKTICGVVNQVEYNNGKKLCQFSWVCSRSKKLDVGPWNDSLMLSEDILNNKVSLPKFNDNVLFFRSVYSKRGFGKDFKFVTRLGHSNFYYRKSV